MKRILYLIAFSIIVFCCNSCGKVDNYAAPSVTLKGSVIDSVTGKTVQTEIGGNGTRVKLMEISWSATPTPYYFYSMQDGTFNYTKLFAGKDIVTVEGPFVPLVQTDNTGNITVNKGKTVDIKGGATLNFNVEPFLRVEWVSDPIFTCLLTLQNMLETTIMTTGIQLRLVIVVQMVMPLLDKRLL